MALGINVSAAVKRRLEWIAAEERISQAEMVSQMVNERAEEIAAEKSKVDRPCSIREILKMRWLDVLDDGSMPLEAMVELRNGRLATEHEIATLASALKIDEDYLKTLERNGYDQTGLNKLHS